jgi:putative membrane protein
VFAWAALAVVLVAVIAFFSVLAFRGYPSWPTMMGGYPFYGWWFFPFGIFFFLFIVFFVFRFIFFGWTWGWRRRYWYGYGYGHGYGDAHEILRQRYARGEITKEQFDQMTRDLEQHQ